MRIAYFVWEYPPRIVGGLGIYASQMVPQLLNLGNEIDVFTINDGKLETREDMGKTLRIHRPMTVEGSLALRQFVCEELRGWGSQLSFFNQILSYNHLSAAKFINELAKNQKYDLVVVNDWLSAISGLIIKENLDIPIVFHVHSTEQQRVGNGSGSIKSLERAICEAADMVITVSYSMKEHLISLGYPMEKINVVWNGCDPGKYSLSNTDPRLVENLKRLYDLGEGENVILFVGRLAQVKGVQNLLLGFPEVLKDHPNTKLIILGKGEEHAEIVRLTKRFGIEDWVKIRSEFVSEEERIAHYALSDVCVFPSTSEPFGIVSLEAMCMKKPIVVGASGISGFREQVVNSGPEKTGVHVDGNNPSDIAWGIKEILKDDVAAKAMGERGRIRAENIFNIKKVAGDTNFLYNKVVKGL
ncbi:MAG: glycosyltransferase family 4 protein [Candidatus Aenigmatarchaeota archaeon]